MSLLVNCLGYRKVKGSISTVPNLKTIRQFNPKLKREITFSIHSPKCANVSPYIFIYSHGNGDNICDCKQLMDAHSRIFKSVFVCYDYLGYGETSGRATEQSSIVICEHVLNYVQQTYKNSKIVLWGRSIGSVPTVAVGSDPRVSCIIVESGLSTALSAACTSPFCSCIDGFKNINRLENVNCPILLMHALDDDTIPYRCSLQNFEILKRKQQCYRNEDSLFSEQINSCNNIMQSGNNWHYTFKTGGHNDLNENETAQIVNRFLINAFRTQENERKSVKTEPNFKGKDKLIVSYI
ncbi:Alpha/beta_hydrolase family protein [Hexamita inflata]|uniref:Alpha/beta hydrolase family protein n=1 Tax=Hexamita inflata TaxID=28002 RepID=A0AA86QN40_9EUKA|nr:Alpha/beta hydrolase family protein [Hexamita inflata]